MGTNTLPTATPGNIIPAEHHNSIKEALGIDLVPRDANGVPTSLAGQIGSSPYVWLRAFLKEILVGLPGDNLKIHSPTPAEMHIEIPNNDKIVLSQGKIEFYTNNVKRFSIQDGGIDWSIIDNFSILTSKLQNRQVFQSPLVTGTIGGTTGLPIGATFNASLVAGRRYVLSTSLDFNVLGAPLDLWIHESNTAGFIKNWGSLSGTTVKKSDDVIFTALVTGNHAFQWWGRRIELIEAQITIKEF